MIDRFVPRKDGIIETMFIKVGQYFMLGCHKIEGTIAVEKNGEIIGEKYEQYYKDPRAYWSI